MAQPAEAEQVRFPVFRRRIEVEDRSSMRSHDLAGEHESPGVDFGGTGGVDGAKIVRRDQQPIGAAGPETRERDRLPAGAREDGPGGAAKQQGRDASSM